VKRSVVRIATLAGVLVVALAAGLGPAESRDESIRLSLLGTHAAGPVDEVFDEGAAEIPAYDPATARVFVVNGLDDVVDILDISDPAHPVEVGELDVSAFGSPNSVDVSEGVVAVASTAVVVEDGENADDPTKPGTVAFFDADGNSLRAPLTVGATPDMVVFTENGDWLLVANEGEPSSYGEPDSVDPEGSISVIDMRSGPAGATIRTAGFGSFEAKRAQLQQAGVRIFGPGATVSQDLEPEYIAVDAGSRTAWVTLQEANAVAELDVNAAKVTAITPLGTKDHSAPGNGLDASDQDGPLVAQRAVRGMYMPDAIAAFQRAGKVYLVTANEGDVREWDGIKGPGSTTEAARAGSLAAQLDAPLGPGLSRLSVTTVPGRAGGDTDGNGKIDVLLSFGSRSMSVWSHSLKLVADTGEQLEQITKATPGVNFNASNTNNTVDNRSDDKGPEPEGVALERLGGTWYAFLALERVGGIVVYDLSDPRAPTFVEYVSNRDFTQPVDSGLAGDLGPEGLIVVRAEDSPTGVPLLVVANEISGTTTIYAIERAK
jgi:DNA-binding beta-propeller fold protein YncE